MAILASIITFLKAFLTLVGLWKEAEVVIKEKKVADRDNESQELDKAVDDLKSAKSEDDFDKAQSEIIKHLPRP